MVNTETIMSHHFPSQIHTSSTLLNQSPKKEKKASLLKKRYEYMPFEYPKAYEFWEKQQQAHWLHNEISMSSDVADWKFHFSSEEKNLIGMVMKGFTQTEMIVNEYWSQKVASVFLKPEVIMMCMAFANMETIHTKAYSYLNETLGIEDYEEFLVEPTVKARMDRLMDSKHKSKEDIARSLAIFSAFTEGVSLFSSFAILLSFSRFNKLKGVGQIIEFSVRDESLHSDAGCWLFRTFAAENPEIITDELKRDIYQAARDTYSIEEAFIDKAFELGDVEGINKSDLKEFVKNRVNVKLGDIGFKPIFDDVSKEAIQRMEWFDFMTVGVSHTDFFSTRVTDYSKGVHSKDKWSEI